MNKISIITDSCCDLSPRIVEEKKIKIVPIYYYFEEENIQYGEEKKLSSNEFFTKILQGLTPKTMGCNPYKVEQLFEEELKKGNDVIYISMSSKLSGSFNHVLAVKNELADLYTNNKIEILDSLTGSMGEGLIVLKAVKMCEELYSFDDIVNYINKNKLCYNIEFFVDDLSYLVKGGRLKNYTAMIGNILNIKPIIKVNDFGEAVETAKIRGEKKAMDLLISRMKDMIDPNEQIISVVHSNYENGAYKLQEKIKGLNNIKKIILTEITPTIACHVGAGNLGLAYKKKKQ